MSTLAATTLKQTFARQPAHKPDTGGFSPGIKQDARRGPDVLAHNGFGLALDIKDIAKSFGNREVIHNVTLNIAAGEFTALVGRSGCGKSTLLRLVAGLETSNRGSVHFDGKTSAGLQADTRIMFQESRLLPWKTVIDNVTLGLPRSAYENARNVLSQVGLAERANDWPAVLSGGQRQRVALARALVHQPRLLLLDEPLGALDALTRIEMQQLIENIWRREGFTALLVTHDVAEAIALADRVVLIEHGQINLDVRIDLPRPRARGTAAFAALEDQVLRRVLQQEDESGPVTDEAIALPFDIRTIRFAI